MTRIEKTYSNVGSALALCASAANPYPPAAYIIVPAGATFSAVTRDPYGNDTTVTLTPSGDVVLPGCWVQLNTVGSTDTVVVVWELF